MEAWAPTTLRGLASKRCPGGRGPLPQSLGFGLDGPLVIKPLSSHFTGLTFAAILAEKAEIQEVFHPKYSWGLRFPTFKTLL